MDFDSLKNYHRCVSYYDKDIVKTMGEFELVDFELEYLRKLVRAPETDPFLLNYYILNEEQVETLNILYDFEYVPSRYGYVLECYWLIKQI